jgi:hypothetical protein
MLWILSICRILLAAGLRLDFPMVLVSVVIGMEYFHLRCLL